MTDYRVTVRVRNNNLLRAITAMGFVPGRKLADAVGVSYGYLNDLINMTISPLDSDGKVKAWVEKLSEVLVCPLDEMFSPEQLEPLKTNKHETEMSLPQLRALTAPPAEEFFERNDMANALAVAFKDLTPKEAFVLTKRFGLDGDEPLDLAATGEEIDVSRERVRQIEAKALRKLRRAHAEKKHDLGSFLGVEHDTY